MSIAQGNPALLISLPRVIQDQLTKASDLAVHVDHNISLELNGEQIHLPSSKAQGKFLVPQGSSEITPIGIEATQPSQAHAQAFVHSLRAQDPDAPKIRESRSSPAKSSDDSVSSTRSPSVTTPEYSSDDRDKDTLEPLARQKKPRLSTLSDVSNESSDHTPNRLTLPSSVTIAGSADWAKHASMFHRVHSKYTQLHERLIKERSALKSKTPSSLTRHDIMLLCNRLSRMESFLVAVREAMVQYKTYGRKSVVKCDAPVY